MSAGAWYYVEVQRELHRDLELHFKSDDCATAMRVADAMVEMPHIQRVALTARVNDDDVLTVRDWKAARALVRRGGMNPATNPRRES